MLPPELLRDALEYAPEAILVSDSSGSIVFANRQTRELFGYETRDLLGINVEQLLPGFRSLFARRKDGSEFPVEIRLSPVGESREHQAFVVATIRDVTAHKRVEAELVAAREAAEQANLAKSRFLSTASHDLRQPLQALALLHGALSRIGKDPNLAEALEQQAVAIGTMSRLMTALLDISKLESGAIKPEVADFAVTPVLEALHGEFVALAGSKGLRFRLASSVSTIHTDPTLLEQILRNLISNAIKYTQEGSVTLHCRSDGATASIEVIDTGIGIAADHVPHIYEDFFRVGGHSRNPEDGYGLGLGIVSRLVKLLELKLEVQSQTGKGSQFRLQVPLGSDQTVASKPGSLRTSAGDGAGKRPRLLLVEDEPAVREATRMLLAAEGFAVATAASHDEAIRKAADATGFDLLLSDYHLGEAATGVEVIASLRARLGADLKAILMTGDTSPAVKSLQLDRNLRMVSKPVAADQLLLLIHELLAAS